MDLLGIGVTVVALLFVLVLHPALRPHASVALVVVGLGMLGYGVVLFFYDSPDSDFTGFGVAFATIGLVAIYWGRRLLRGGRKSDPWL